MKGKNLTKVSVAVIVLVLAFIVNEQLRKRKPETEVIETPAGRIQGSVSTSRDGREYYEFLGIPYAKPPVGELRFEVNLL